MKSKKEKKRVAKLTEAKGNIYPFATHCLTHIHGECSMNCIYCFAQSAPCCWSGKYKGELRLWKDSFDIDLGTGRVIFLEHLNDIMAPGVKDTWIKRILAHACEYPDNVYLLQSKNPARFKKFLKFMPPHVMLGTTIETNRHYEGMSTITTTAERARALKALKGVKKFVTVEPILDFDLKVLVKWIKAIKPELVNLGANSKKHIASLKEPDAAKIKAFRRALMEADINMSSHTNLARLAG